MPIWVSLGAYYSWVKVCSEYVDPDTYECLKEYMNEKATENGIELH